MCLVSVAWDIRGGQTCARFLGKGRRSVLSGKVLAGPACGLETSLRVLESIKRPLRMRHENPAAKFQ